MVLDSYDDHDRDARAAENAARAGEDAGAVAYLGDFHSSQVWASAPVLAEAGLLGVAPVATYVALRGATLVRLTPDDAAGARAIADWLDGVGVEEVLVVHDHDEHYGTPVGAMCVAAARERGLRVRSRPVWDHDEEPAEDVDGAGAVLYVGVAGSGAVRLWHQLHEADPELWLLGSDGVAVDWLARELEPPIAARTRFFTAARAPMALYGHEAMRLIIDSVAAGGGDRAAIVRAARATRDRDSVIGRYSLDAEGLTTAAQYGRLAVVDGRLVYDTP